MRAFFLAALVLVPVLLTANPACASSLCGRPDYPDSGAYRADAVVQAGLWDSLRARDGFANGTEGVSRLEVRVPDAGRTFVVTLAEVVVRTYVGGSATNVTAVALRVGEETGGGPTVPAHNFTIVDFGGLAGGNLTLVAWLDGGALEIFWRWAYLACSDEFPNLYYVFHGRVDGGAIEDDNALVYFEAVRPKRGPPLDLIVLVVAGSAASAIFLYARHALKKRPAPETHERTVK
ncbi:MAG TPA: hypothetical protein VGR51_03730 [Thermoplasmata archaeon]|jgi:hypothetical protein|nr:hypothetical protein [Thermoplasmata archaeon]